MLNVSVKNLDRLCLVVVLVVVILSGSFAAKANIKRKKQIRQENELLSNRLKDIKTAKQKAKRLEEILDNSKKQLEVLGKKIPGTADIGLFFNHLDALMKERNLELISVQPQSGIKENSITRIPIRLMFKGSFVDIFNMIHALETMDRTVVLARVAIEKSRSNGECKTDMMASIFKK